MKGEGGCKEVFATPCSKIVQIVRPKKVKDRWTRLTCDRALRLWVNGSDCDVSFADPSNRVLVSSHQKLRGRSWPTHACN